MLLARGGLKKVSPSLPPRVRMFPTLSSKPYIRVWRHREYALYESGMTLYSVTGWIQRVGVGWLAWELTRSTFWLGVMAAADLGPMIVLAPFVENSSIAFPA